MAKNTKKSFETTLKLTHICLLFSGIRIYEKDYGKVWKNFIHFLFYFNFSFLYFDLLGELWWLIDGIQAAKSIVELSLTAPCLTISLLGSTKVILLFKNQHAVLKLVKKMRDIHPKDTADDNNLNEVQDKIVRESIKSLSLVISLLYLISGVVTVAFTLLPTVSMVYDYCITGETEVKYPYMVKYFFDPYIKELWPFLYLHQVYSTVVVAANICGSDTLLYALCIYLQMHFRILCHNFENVVVDSSEDSKLNFKKCVKKHQELIRLAVEIDVLYSKSSLFNIVTSSILICLSGFNMTVMHDIMVIAAFGSFLMMSLSQIFLLCYFGDMLTTSSASVSNAVYNSQWYKWYSTDGSTNRTANRSVLLVLIRAQKPCKLTAANFADLNLRAFATILSRSWSYFALLRSMYN